MRDPLTPHCDYLVQAAARDGIPSLLELGRDCGYRGRSREKATELEFHRATDGLAALPCQLEGAVVSGGTIPAEIDRAGAESGHR
jgi:hypothetical protein